jgi:hypothetical protein
MGRPEEIANAALILGSDESNFVSGIDLVLIEEWAPSDLRSVLALS